MHSVIRIAVTASLLVHEAAAASHLRKLYLEAMSPSWDRFVVQVLLYRALYHLASAA